MKNASCLLALALVAWFALASPSAAVTQQQADALYAAQDWQGATHAYETLLEEDGDNAQNWFNLGRSRHALGDHRGARRAYLNALDRNHPSAGRVRYHLARTLMTLGRRTEAMRQIQQLVGSGVSGAVLSGTQEFQPLADTPQFVAVVAAQTPCSTPEYRQFDFWLGEWEIFATTGGASLGRNSITSQQGGCVVQEQYATPGGFTGMSINFYDSARRVWHQTWMSNQGSMLYLEGGLNAIGAMELTDRGLAGAAPGVINRTTWTPLPDGGLRQLWDRSSDNGATWTTVFDGRYVRANHASPGP